MIADAGKALGVTVSSYDLHDVLTDVVTMLNDYGVASADDIQRPMLDLVKYTIEQHRRK